MAPQRGDSSLSLTDRLRKPQAGTAHSRQDPVNPLPTGVTLICAVNDLEVVVYWHRLFVDG